MYGFFGNIQNCQWISHMHVKRSPWRCEIRIDVSAIFIKGFEKMSFIFMLQVCIKDFLHCFISNLLASQQG